MLIFINSSSQTVPDDVNTVGKVLDYIKISRQGTGVGLNNRLVPARDWDHTTLKPEDKLLVISATYGG